MVSETSLEPGSFRDKTNRVFYQDDRVYRSLTAEALADWKALTATSFYAALVQDSRLVITRSTDITPPPTPPGQAPWEAVLEHERVPFISYPYEWPFGMLKDAALLQLEITRLALSEGFSVKDATPYNVQWHGSRPFFIDVMSFTKWVPGSPWAGYRQFCELFLFPLFLQAYRDISFRPWLRGSLEGIPLDECRRIWSLRDLLRPGLLTHVFLHAHVQKQFAESQKNVKTALQQAGFHKELILANIKKMEATVRQLSWERPGSEWSDYATACSYSSEDYERKKKFVGDFIRSKPRRWVWDLGCNTGDFSRLAAEHAEGVVSMDADAWVIEGFYRRLRQEKNTRIWPLVMNLADLSAGLGWRGAERKALIDRGRPDLTLCLALIHHIVISAHIPMQEWIQWLADLRSDLVIEFVTRQDPMTQRLLRNKEGRHDDYEKEHFETVLSRAFTIVQTLPLSGGTRIMYACHPKSN